MLVIRRGRRGEGIEEGWGRGGWRSSDRLFVCEDNRG